ncbi:MAG: radical SAM protein [uncultured bacterium]|nr:MAG: radical SAM protein [uncultured bacterium]
MNIAERPFDKKLSSIIIKVTNICNFVCPYCYMFQAVDSSYKNRPKIMPKIVIMQLVNKLDKYLHTFQIDNMNLIIHGGEPLLMGKKGLIFLLNQLDKLRKKYQTIISLQSNGSLIDKEFVNIFTDYRISVGISLDGYPEIQNKAKTKSGKPTYELIVRGIQLLLEKLDKKYFSGLMSVIDLNGDPIKIYRHFTQGLGIKKMDFLLPLRNHKFPFDYIASDMKIFNWLKPIFDQYLADDNDEIEIRIFNSIMELLLGAQTPMCTIRHSALDILTIETNGNIELVDDLRICGEDFTNIGLNIANNDIEEFFDSKRVLQLLDAEQNLPTKCLECKHFDICGSGGHAFRFGLDGTYNYPSIYCEETKALIGYIEQNIFEEEDIDQDTKDSNNDFYLQRKGNYQLKYQSDEPNINWSNGFKQFPVEIYASFIQFINSNGNILDLGCGNGQLLRFLVENSQHKLIPHGIDFRQEVINEAKEIILPDFADNFRIGNITKIDLENNLFDYILLDPYHLADCDRKNVIQIIIDKLRKNGRVILYSYHDSLSTLPHKKIKFFIGVENFDLSEEFVLPNQVSITYIDKI